MCITSLQNTCYNLPNMHRKKWPYWLRGGIIGGGVAILSGVFLYFCVLMSKGWGVLGCAYFLIFEFYPANWFKNSLGVRDIYFSSPTASFTGSIIVWFIIGAFIGFLIDLLIALKKKGSPV